MEGKFSVYWLQGYLEIAAAGGAAPPRLTPSQVDTVRRHLALVFKHEIDPSMGDEKQQDALNQLHQLTKDHVPTMLRCGRQ